MTSHEDNLVTRLADRIVELREGNVDRDYLVQQSIITSKIVEFDIQNAAFTEKMTLIEGILHWQQQNDRYTVKIQSNHCDTFLKTVLQHGGSIVSVTSGKAAEARTSSGDLEDRR